ncbi:M10 family metallopeptidase C-terminal domain-containing protein [Qipengyuania vesicularis]|uniref:M10 family metallopeptidase C-terminal domain-containing protein n=1 Tax=Qipengyuania vesicularis TaxID=2867232 RepID=UPI001C8894E2|nr:M10 family metallopeptidase C-terminal domain-containing protein [Qipengyuania vesicularis]MBX7526394.1 M10 family metallopeptidase C-terminal domain-containing protein [Qipengyuania vesicularis]
MAETFLNSGWDSFFGDEITRPLNFDARAAAISSAVEAAVRGGEISTHPDLSLGGTLEMGEGGDIIALNLVAGQTYTWSFRGTEDGIEDPFMFLLGTDFSIITTDDDGGFGRTSQITFTAPADGTYFLYLTSWYELVGLSDFDTGDYTLVQWSPDPAHDAPDSFATTETLSVGTNYGYVDVPGDNDMYSITVEQGYVYNFSFSGGVSGQGDFDFEPGEAVVTLELYNEAGELIGTNLNYESSLSYFAATGGTVYVRTVDFGAQFGLDFSGGYTIDVEQLDPADFDPLDSLNWDSAANIPTVLVDGVPTAYVYFAPAGENFGQFEPDGVTPMATFGWQQYQIDAIMDSLNTYYTPITGIDYVITTDVDEATFRLLTTENLAYGARFFPQDAAAYGDDVGIGIFNLLSGGFGAFPESLDPGGFSWAVVLHEFGHAHGIAHPHDTGGGSDVMLGVTSSASLGVYDLNQGVYTVMSYNDGWITHPDGERAFTGATLGDGWSESLGAFDIAVLQARYGVHDYNTGDDVYMLTDNQEEASYLTIWDSGGTDEIRYDGEVDVRIDLLAATLDYTPTGGGVVSFVDGVFGGYTIANSVVIENASGGEGNDVILGNEYANVLSGNDGDDIIMGRDGADDIFGGNDNDELYGDGGDDFVSGGNGEDSLFGGMGDDILQGGNASDFLSGDEGDDMLYGGNGADILNGGAGADILNGGRGPDLFVFDNFDGAVDTVVGYDARNDSIQIDSDGSVQWAQGDNGAVLYVDGVATAVFQGQSAGVMASEWAGSEVIGFANSFATADLFTYHVV